MNNKIYRFLSFESFVDMVLRKELAFVTYDMWQDPYEGFVLKVLQSESGKCKIQQWLQQYLTAFHNESLFLFEASRRAVHLQSWTKNPESDALWRIYSHNENSVRIQISIKNINFLQKVKYFKVEYKPTNLERELNKIFVKDGGFNMAKVFEWKRGAFKHEQEVRLCTDIDHDYLAGRISSGGSMELQRVKKKIENLVHTNVVLETIEKTINDINQIKYVPFSHISNFIETVLVNPFAADWFVQTVKQFCENNKITCLGRSDLYKFKH